MFVTNDGVSLHVRETGTGAPVVLLHGWPDEGELWRHQTPALAAAGYRVIVPDLRGFGASDKPADVAAYPLAAHWGEGEPISGIDVMAGIEDRYRRLVVDGAPVATGVVPVGDACAATNPSLGRGASMALSHGFLLRDLLRETDPQEHDKLARRFDEATAKVIEPLYQMTLWTDRHRLAEIDADVAGRPYEPADPRWSAGKALFAASLTDPELARAYSAIGALIALPSDVFANPDVPKRIAALGGAAPQYPLPGPRRAELLERIR